MRALVRDAVIRHAKVAVGSRRLFSGQGEAGTSPPLARFQPEGSPDMRSSMAYFAGAGTVVVAVVAGLGGGLLFANMISPKAPKMEQTRLGRRMSPEPIQASNAPAEPVPYLATPQPSAPGGATRLFRRKPSRSKPRRKPRPPV